MRNKVIFIVSAHRACCWRSSAPSSSASSRRRSRRCSTRPPIPTPRASTPTASSKASRRRARTSTSIPRSSGPITQVLVAEGAKVHKGRSAADDRRFRAAGDGRAAAAQAEAALALLDELKAEPRPETLAVAAAQVDNARATLKNAQDQLAKQEQSYAIDPKSVSRDALDNARNAEKIAATNLEVVQKQYSLTKAGAWIYDIREPGEAVRRAVEGLRGLAALLDKYTIRAPTDGVVLLDPGRGRQLCLAAGRLRFLHAGPESAHRHGHAGRQSASARAMSTRSWFTACPIRPR